jgi:hypothetical protein
VAHVLRKAQAKKRQRHPAALVLLPHKQQHPAAPLNVVDVALPGGGGFPGEALALPVELQRGDGDIVGARVFIGAEGFCLAVGPVSPARADGR